MRVIERKMLRAIDARRNWRCGNTRTEILFNNFCVVYLHNNPICVIDYAREMRYFSSCGWNTNTTKSRLNALGARIYQRNWIWYYNSGVMFHDEDLWGMIYSIKDEHKQQEKQIIPTNFFAA